jgi:hypothetical protein
MILPDRQLQQIGEVTTTHGIKQFFFSKARVIKDQAHRIEDAIITEKRLITWM